MLQKLKEKYKIEAPDPLSAIKFRMEQQGLKNNDLIPYIGSKSKVSEIGELYKFLVLEANNLTSESLTIKNASNQISLQATRMKESVHEQNSSITETSAAMTEISANISNINGIANKRRAGMNEIEKDIKIDETPKTDK